MGLLSIFSRGKRTPVQSEPPAMPLTHNALTYSFSDPQVIEDEQTAPAHPVVNVGVLPDAFYTGNGNFTAPSVEQPWNGDKWYGSFGDTKLFDLDYWTLRERSVQLFYDNLYAKGIIRRLVTNIINVGLHLECEPEEQWLGMSEDALADWSERTETQFSLWAGDAKLCDYHGRESFGRIQNRVKQQALIEGDVLVIIHTARNGRPIRVEIISGAYVDTSPQLPIPDGHTVDWGVEWDASGREVAYHVMQKDGSYKRVLTHGVRSGRRVAKLVRGFDGLSNERRGEPLLGILLQSIKDLDRYRDAAVRKAVLNAIIVGFISKGEDKIGSKPLTNGAVRRDQHVVADPDGTARNWNVKNQVPGLYMEELNQNEKPEVHSTAGTDSRYGEFEAAVLHAMAWACEIPPEILELAFSSNYSASQAALQEFIIFLMKERAHFADELLHWVYEEWVLTESLAGRLDRGQEILTAWREPGTSYNFQAWIRSEWYGAIKPSTDPLKMVKALTAMVNEGALTRDRMARMLSGTKYSKNIQKLKRENEQLAEVREILAPEEPEQAGNMSGDALAEMITGAVVEVMGDRTDA